MAVTTITVRLRNKLVKIHESRRHKKTISYLRQHIARHFKSKPESIKISQKLNEYLEANSYNRYKPITITINKTAEMVEAALPNEKKVDAAPAKKGAAAPAATSTTATNKAAADVQKEVANDISKKVEQKKEAAKQGKPAAEAPKKSSTEKPKAEVPKSEPAA